MLLPLKNRTTYVDFYFFVYFFPYPAIPIKPIPKKSIMAGSGIGASACIGVARVTDAIPMNKQAAAKPIKSFFFIIPPPY